MRRTAARAADALEDACRLDPARANAQDLEAGRAPGPRRRLCSTRLTLNPERIAAMADGLREVAALPDPVGEITAHVEPAERPAGRAHADPLGVILVIYESRPNVTADVAALCLKSGNAAILRGGSEALHSNRALAEPCCASAIAAPACREDAVAARGHIRSASSWMRSCSRDDAIDLVIPRGGESLIRRVVEQSRIPVIKHYRGLCHVYLDEFAEPKMARDDRGELEGAARVGVQLGGDLARARGARRTRCCPTCSARSPRHGVELRGCARTRERFPQAAPATDADYHTEWLAKVMSVRMVDSIDQAIEHIRNVRHEPHRDDRHAGRAAAPASSSGG